MSFEGNLSADGNTAETRIQHNDGTHFAVSGTWGSGTITIQQKINESWYPATYSTGADITHTDDFNEVLYFREGDIVRLNLSGATSPDLDFAIR